MHTSSSRNSCVRELIKDKIHVNIYISWVAVAGSNEKLTLHLGCLFLCNHWLFFLKPFSSFSECSVWDCLVFLYSKLIGIVFLLCSDYKPDSKYSGRKRSNKFWSVFWAPAIREGMEFSLSVQEASYESVAKTRKPRVCTKPIQPCLKLSV